MRLKRCERCQKIDGFQQAGFALGIAANQQNSPPGYVYIQAGEIAKVGQR